MVGQTVPFPTKQNLFRVVAKETAFIEDLICKKKAEMMTFPLYLSSENQLRLE